jgi:hypothetical protein
MKPEKLYTVGRSAARRAGRPVIIGPKPEPPDVVVVSAPVAQPPVNSSAVRNVRSRLWSVATVVGPATVAIAALVISLLNYEDQHQVDEAAVAASQRHQAGLVSFILQQGNGPSNETVLINNSSDNPVNDVQLASNVAFEDGRSYLLEINLGAIPACSVGRVTSSMIADYLRAALFPYMQNKNTQYEEIDGNYQFTVASMLFTDSNGIAWKYPEGGPVENTPSYASSFGGSLGYVSPAVISGSVPSPVVISGSAWSAVVVSGSALPPGDFSYYASPSWAVYITASPSKLTKNPSLTNSLNGSGAIELSMPGPSFPLLSYWQAGGCS